MQFQEETQEESEIRKTFTQVATKAALVDSTSPSLRLFLLPATLSSSRQWTWMGPLHEKWGSNIRMAQFCRWTHQEIHLQTLQVQVYAVLQ